MGDEVEFLPADEHKSFLQDDSTTSFFEISQGKHEG